MTIPYLDVAHLPSAASFFSSILQPLGCYYTVSENDLEDAKSLQFVGSDGAPFLIVRRNPNSGSPLRLSNLTIAAPSQNALVAFHDNALGANPALYLSKINIFTSSSARNTSSLSPDECHAMVHDLEGNRLEAVYPDQGNGNVKYRGQSMRETQSTRKEVSRILDWNYDVASAAPRTSPQPIKSSHQRAVTPPSSSASLRRSPMRGSQHNISTSSVPTAAATSNQKAAGSEEEGGISATTVVGALLGVAAGAGVLYSMFGGSKEEERKMKEQPYASRIHQVDQKSTIDDLAHREYIYAGGDGQQSGVQDRDFYSHERSKPRSFADPWHKATSPPSRHYERTPPVTRAIEDARDGRSSHSSRFNGGRSLEAQARSVERNNSERDAPEPRLRSSSKRRSVTGDEDHNNYARSRRGSVVSDKPASRRGSVEEEEYRAPETSRGCAITRYADVSRQMSAPRHVDIPRQLDVAEDDSSRRPEAPRQSSHVDDGERRHRRSSRKGSTTGESERRGRGESRRRSRSRAYEHDRESYASARTHRTSSTPRPPLTRPPPSDHGSLHRHRNRAASRSSGARTPKATTPDDIYHQSKPSSYISARNVPLPNSEVSARCVPIPISEASLARHIALPMSGVGSSHAEWDDDLVSLVPDDSISCVGKKHRRSRRS